MIDCFVAGTLFGATKIPVLDSSGGIAPFCDATGQFMPLLCTMNCTLAPEEVFASQDPTACLADILVLMVQMRKSLVNGKCNAGDCLQLV